MKNPISPIIIERIPQFIKEGYPNLFKILSDYYSWLEEYEEKENYLHFLEGFLENSEPNYEKDPYIDLILQELGCNFNDKIRQDKKLVINSLRDFYLSRGNSYSFEYLFRAVFNESVKVDYPRKRLMYLSSADYSSDSEVLITAEKFGTPEFEKVFSNDQGYSITITGLNSGSECNAGEFQIVIIDGKYFVKIGVDQNTAQFKKDEVVTIRSDNGASINETIVETISFRQIVYQGNNYEINDEIVIEECMVKGKILVSNITRGYIYSVSVDDSGTGYAVGDTVSAVTNGRSGMGFFGRVSTVYGPGSPKPGGVFIIDVLNQGYEYDKVPELVIHSETGSGAIIHAIGRKIGGIKEITIEEPYWKRTRPSDILHVTINSLNGDGAEIEFDDTLCVFNQNKSHKNKLGVLGYESIIPDNLYFQEYSYEVRSTASPKEFNDLIDEYVHPVGLMRYSILEKDVNINYNFNSLDRVKFIVKDTLSGTEDLKIEDVEFFKYNAALAYNYQFSSEFPSYNFFSGERLTLALKLSSFSATDVFLNFNGEICRFDFQSKVSMDNEMFTGEHCAMDLMKYTLINPYSYSGETFGTALTIPSFTNQIITAGELSEANLAIPSPEAGVDHFGSACALSANGMVLVVGSDWWGGSTSYDYGGIITYDRVGNSWVQRGSILVATDKQDIDLFGSACSLSADGSVLAVGARGWEGLVTNQGAVYIYDRNGSSWTQRGSILTAPDALTAGSGQFGSACSLSSDGEVLAVGAHHRDDVVTYQGGVYIFDRDGDSWVQRGSVLTAPGDAACDFGSSCSFAAYGTILAVGARTWNINQGGVFIFDQDTDSWALRGVMLEAADGLTDDYFGSACSLSDDGKILTVGAFNAHGPVLNHQGKVYTFDKVGSAWTPRRILYATEGGYDDQFGSGCSLSADGKMLVVGAQNWDGYLLSQGGLYTYDENITIESGSTFTGWKQRGFTLFL
jgi:hypothetical protein